MVDQTIETNPQFGIGPCVGSAWATVRDNWFSLVSAAFLRELISILAAGLAFTAFIDLGVWSLAIACVVKFLVWSAIQAGYLRFCLNICANNAAQWRDLISGVSSGLGLFAAMAIVWCAVALGLVLLVVPGLFLASRVSLYGLALIDQKLNPIKAIATSHRMLKGHGWCAACIVVVYGFAIVIWGLLNAVLEPLMMISLCTLYRHARVQEENR